jgi:hypothetical protein
MPGCISGFYGFQRSGKTLMAYLIAENMHNNLSVPVYSNMEVPGWITIEALTDIPLNYKPKVLLLDETYYFMDSRSWQDNKESSIFFNTIGKQQICLMLTAIDPGEVEIRLRRQHNFMYIVKSDELNIYYRVIDVQRNKLKDFSIKKTPEFFAKLKYDTNQVPGYVDCNIKNFIKSRNKILENII